MQRPGPMESILCKTITMVAASSVGLAACVANVEDGPGANSAGQQHAVTVVENEEELNLVARADIDGAVIRFFEPEPGVVLVMESGRIERGALLDDALRELPPAVLYERVTGAPAPAALVAATARMSEVAARKAALPRPPAATESDAAEPAEEGGADEGLIDKTRISSQGFLDSACLNRSGSQRSANFTYQTGNRSFNWEDMNRVVSRAMAYRGSVRLRARQRTFWQWSAFTYVTVPQGEYMEIYMTNDDLDFDWHSGVDLADGDGYHFCSWGSS